MHRLPTRRALLLTSSLIVAFACAKPLPPQEPVRVGPVQMGAGEWRVVEQVVVITDASGTMYQEKTFPEAKALSRSFVASMPDADAPAARRGYRAGLIGFGGDDRTTAPLASFDRSRLASTAADVEIMGDVSGTGGTTPLQDVLLESAAALEGKGGRSALVIFLLILFIKHSTCSLIIPHYITGLFGAETAILKKAGLASFLLVLNWQGGTKLFTTYCLGSLQPHAIPFIQPGGDDLIGHTALTELGANF